MDYILFIIFAINACSCPLHLFSRKRRYKEKERVKSNVMYTEALYANEVEQHDDENQNT
jgi:hypothetical protein